MITGGFLASDAEIVDGTLSVTGGVLDWIEVPPLSSEESGLVYLVTLMQAGPDDHGKPYRMKLEFIDPDGNSTVAAEGEIAVDAHFGENRFWVTPIAVKFKASGRAVLVNSIEGGGSISIPVHVRVQDS